MIRILVDLDSTQLETDWGYKTKCEFTVGTPDESPKISAYIEAFISALRAETFSDNVILNGLKEAVEEYDI